jgi:hypothetical protein
MASHILTLSILVSVFFWIARSCRRKLMSAAKVTFIYFYIAIAQRSLSPSLYPSLAYPILYFSIRSFLVC